MEQTTVEMPGAAPITQPSTVLDPGTTKNTSGGGQPQLSEPSDKQSVESVLEGELSRLKAEDAKERGEVEDKAKKATDEAKAKVEDAEKDEKPKADKADKTEDKAAQPKDEKGRFAKVEKADDPAEADKSEAEKPATGQEGQDRRQSEGRQHQEPPARFLPKAKEVWSNVPHAVKGEIARMAQEHEAEVAQYKEARDRYETIRQFDETARTNGRDLKDSLAKVAEVERALAQNPIAGLEAVLREIGPRKADGSHVSLMDVVNYVAQNPQAYQQAINQPRQAPQQRQPDPEVLALKQEIQSMRAEQTVQSIITPFAAQNPRFHELQDDIAFFLNSGKIPASLSPQERLEAAYDMAVRINPTSSVAPPQAAPALADATPAPSTKAGTKSIRGAPANGVDTETEEAKADLETMLRKEYRRMIA